MLIVLIEQIKMLISIMCGWTEEGARPSELHNQYACIEGYHESQYGIRKVGLEGVGRAGKVPLGYLLALPVQDLSLKKSG